MAVSGKVPMLLSLGIALFLVTQLAHPADASAFTVYSGPDCSGDESVLSACGCNEVPAGQNAGYNWVYQGQTSAAYNDPDCTGTAQTHFSSSVGPSCSSFGWQSFFIQC